MISRPVLVIVALVIAISIAAGVMLPRFVRSHASPEAAAEALSDDDEFARADDAYWTLIQKGPITVSLVVAFLDNHALATRSLAGTMDDEGRMHFDVKPEKAVDERLIDALFVRTDLPKDVALLGPYWRDVTRGLMVDEERLPVERAADAEPPMPWANRLLARAAVREHKTDEAIARYLREGKNFDERAEDIGVALGICAREEDWDAIEEALADPRVASKAEPWLVVRAAVHARDWKRAVRAFPRMMNPHATAPALVLAGVSAFAWWAFCARLGDWRRRPRVRIPLFLLAFALGFASAWITDAIILLEEDLLHLVDTGRPLPDFLFFTFGVGLREEISKLAMFALLIPLLRRTDSRLDVIICGAIVGLGFAASENIMYLQSGNLTTAMARFLTANFLHMSMTAILGFALFEHSRDFDKHANDLSKTVITVVGLHGAYDFCLSSRAYGDLSYLSMAVFFLLARRFLQEVSVARRIDRVRPVPVVGTFVIGSVFVVGASFVYASARVGPGQAGLALAEGLLGLAIIGIIFVQELRRV